jgi:hypothetical protein
MYGFGAKASPGVNLSDKEGEFVSLILALTKKRSLPWCLPRYPLPRQVDTTWYS